MSIILTVVIALFGSFAFVLFKYRSCLRANLYSMAVFLVIFLLAEGVYSGFHDFTAGDRDRAVAVATAICPPAPELSCAASRNRSGYSVSVISGLPLPAVMIDEITERGKRVKPILDGSLVHLEFFAQPSLLSKDARQRLEQPRSVVRGTYKTVNF